MFTTETTPAPYRAPKAARKTSPAPGHPKAKRIVAAVVTQIVVIIGVLMSIFPFYWLVVMSTNTTSQIFGFPPKLTIGGNFITNIKNVFANVDILGALGNTLIVSLAVAVLVMLFDSLAAFAFAKYRFPGQKGLFAMVLVTFMIPAQLSLVPNFVIMANIGWAGTLQALIVPGAANAFGIFLLRQLAAGAIPDELIESARMDGAGFFRTYWAVAVPMLRGGLAFLGIFTFIGAWNDYVWPLIVLVNPQRQTLQVALSQLFSVHGTDYGMVMAGALISVVPLIGIFLIGSRHFIANIAAGAVKG